LRVSHLGICVSDLERSRAFYRDALGLTHLSLRMDEIDASVARLPAHGARMLRDTHIDNASLRAKAVFVTDPDGTLIELVETKPRDTRP